MPCFHPVQAYRLAGSGAYVFTRPSRQDFTDELKVPCRRCVGCRIDRSKAWALRVMHEASMHQANCFLTLTYDEANLPSDGSLRYSDVQLFLKRMRKRVGRFRYYLCGEYGDTTWRPHYHLCIFGYDFPDRRTYSQSESGEWSYSSAILDSLWGRGQCTVGNLTLQSASYVARYCLKKVVGDLAEGHYSHVDSDGVIHRRAAEFNCMSLKPGIGSAWLDQFGGDVFNRDYVATNDGRQHAVPAYYLKRLKKANPDEHERIMLDRFDSCQLTAANRTPERLAVRKEVFTARTNQLKRNLL